MPPTPQVVALLEMVYRVGAPRFHELSVSQARHSFQKLLFAFRPESVPVASVTDVPIPRPDGTVLLGRYYRPLARAPEERIPLLVFLHGGGWCVGDVESYDVFCRELANGSECAVLSVDYRLAPEHPFPSAMEDALLAVRWAASNADLLVINPRRIALGGDSAGGNLSIVASLVLREASGLELAYLMLIYPCTEVLSSRASRSRYSSGYFLDRESLEWFFSRYLPGGEHEDWRASPMRAPSLAGLPPTLLVAAEYDPLVDDCRAFAERVRAEGGHVEYKEVAGMIHGFITLGKYFPEAGRTVREVSAALKDALL